MCVAYILLFFKFAVGVSGKLVSIKGSVVRVGNRKLLCTWMAFECNACQAITCIRQPDGKNNINSDSAYNWGF